MGFARAGKARNDDELGMPIVNACKKVRGIGADSQALQAMLVWIRDGNFVDCGEFKAVLECGRHSRDTFGELCLGPTNVTRGTQKYVDGTCEGRSGK